MELELGLLAILGSRGAQLHYSYMELELYNIIIQCLYLIYYIIPIWNWSEIDSINRKLNPDYYIIPIWNWSLSFVLSNRIIPTNYIIPIWNWSPSRSFFLPAPCLITLFLYGIGAISVVSLTLNLQSITLFLYGIGASVILIKSILSFFNYIIPIWNWSFAIVFALCLMFNYIIPIWNWSRYIINFCR